ncbi:MAG: tryptophan 2,3-dioxygenase family protein [Emcibacteraceae bacterium]|nr:tryptophan 2,3-dioxygenase family protein [Emcibacteraceae bacterium]MDG1996605.1 tryptophan 2,3-dioxygenase family protein [Emcibacteraceae bacterium]
MSIDIKSYKENGIETFEAKVNDETIKWDKDFTYKKHLQLENLLSSQAPVSDQPEELLFITMHQSMEIWIRQCIHEIRTAAKLIKSDELEKSFKTFDRITVILRHMINSWEVLATLTPADFLTFRDYLGKASGFQSYQYRELEFLLGNKNEDLIVVHRDNEEISKHLHDTLNAPSVYDEVLMYLDRNGFEIDEAIIDRDWSKPYKASKDIEVIWQEIYTNVDQHWNLYTFGEKITSLEYYLQEWRFKHMKTVSRVIGKKVGTGGSSGVNYLVKMLDHTFFPELWSMRTSLATGEKSNTKCPM